MKKADEYIEELGRSVTTLDGNISERVVSIEKARVAVKNAQIDAIDEAVKRCAENAKLTMKEEYGETSRIIHRNLDRGSTNTSEQDYYYYVNKDSILQVADKLKKELE